MQEATAHRCIPIILKPCPSCGETLTTPEFCEHCGENITPEHVCKPKPLAHTCSTHETASRCLNCGEVIPAAQYCPTCGEKLEAVHQCATSGVPTVRRAQPVHVCRAQPLPRCDRCGALLPPLKYCELCGMDITAQHTCQTSVLAHACAPYLLMPRPCPRCGEVLPARTHCTQCGKEITAEHVCQNA
jgi:uncharacterized OB-fold protein